MAVTIKPKAVIITTIRMPLTPIQAVHPRGAVGTWCPMRTMRSCTNKNTHVRKHVKCACSISGVPVTPAQKNTSGSDHTVTPAEKNTNGSDHTVTPAQKYTHDSNHTESACSISGALSTL